MRVARVIVHRRHGGDIDQSCAHRMIRALTDAGAVDVTYGSTREGFEIEFVGEYSLLRRFKRLAAAQGLRVDSVCWPMPMPGHETRYLRAVPDDRDDLEDEVAVALGGPVHCAVAATMAPKLAFALAALSPFT